MTLLRITVVAIGVFNLLPSCHAEFNNSTTVSRQLRGLGNSKAFALQQKEATNVTSPERSLQALASKPVVLRARSDWAKMAQMTDPLGIVGSSLGALSNLLAMDNPSLKDVADEAVNVGLAVVSAVNPIVGAVATFFWGLIVGSSAPRESEAQQLFKYALKEARQYTDDAIFVERLRECCGPGSGLSHELETLLRGSALSGLGSKHDELVFLRTRYENIREKRGNVFGECVSGNDADGCRDWQQKGGAVALIAGLSLATTEIALLEHMSILAANEHVTKDTRQLIAADGAEYVSLLKNHYEAFQAYRLSFVEGVKGTFKKECGFDINLNLGSGFRRLSSKDVCHRHIWQRSSEEKKSGVDTYPEEKSYLHTCDLTDAKKPDCDMCPKEWCPPLPENIEINLNLGFGFRRLCSKSAPVPEKEHKACREKNKCDVRSVLPTKGECVPSGLALVPGLGKKCCSEEKPCVQVEYEKCTQKYKDNLSAEMDKKFKARIDQFAKAVQPVISEVAAEAAYANLVELGAHADAEPRICASEHSNPPCTCNGLIVYGQRFVSAKKEGQLTTIHDILKTKKYKTKVAHGLPTVCGNDAMGGDPLKGYLKHCYCLESPKQGGRRLRYV